MITCSKRFSDIPFAHRQPNHPGHCRFIHGHNWSFEITFAAKELDPCGFVVDFGRLGDLKNRLNFLFDHAVVLNEDDSLLKNDCWSRVVSLLDQKLTLVPDCSCEGLAKYVFELADKFVMMHSMGRAFVVSVTCFEDSKNSATYDKA